MSQPAIRRSAKGLAVKKEVLDELKRIYPNLTTDQGKPYTWEIIAGLVEERGSKLQPPLNCHRNTIANFFAGRRVNPQIVSIIFDLLGYPFSIDGKISNNLPGQLTSFVGREKEIADVKALLQNTRLLTLTGMGGGGKTRLALQVASDVLEQYPDGVWLVEFALLADFALVPQTVAQVLGIKEQAGRSIEQTLTEHLKSKRLLLLLDNCEHLLQVSADLAVTLLRSCPNVKVLATSREAMRVAGELTYPVPPLSIPDPEQTLTPEGLIQYEAVRLFIERAQCRKSTFAMTNQNSPALAQVCFRLDGIPLAIELAAAWIRAMSVEDLNKRLDDRFRLLIDGDRTALPKQQALHATMKWSYDLLNSQEKALLARLSVFVGGWTLEAAEQVCSGGSATEEAFEKSEVLNLLTSLVDKSLVIAEEQNGSTRYRMLETVREYAAAKLEGSGETAQVKTRHRDWFLSLAEDAEPQLRGPEQSHWFQRLDTEYNNLRMAIACCKAMEGGAEAGLRLTAALLQFWVVRGYMREGQVCLAEAVAREDATDRTQMRAKALNAAGNIAKNLGDYGSVRILYEESLAIVRELGVKSGIAASLNNLGNLAYVQGDYDTAKTLYDKSLATRRELEDESGIATSLHNLGHLALVQGDYDTAKTLLEESLATRRELGDKSSINSLLHNLGILAHWQGDYSSARMLYEESMAIEQDLGDKLGVAGSLTNLGIMAFEQGDYDTARTLYEESMAIKRELGDKLGVAASLNNLGALASEQGDFASARQLYEQSLTIQRELGNRWGIGGSLYNLGTVDYDEGDYDAARTMYADSLAIFRDLRYKQAIALSLEAFASLALADQSPKRAAKLLGAAVALREIIKSPLPLNERGKHEREVTAVREALGESAFTAAWEEGRAMTWEQAVELALGTEKE